MVPGEKGLRAKAKPPTFAASRAWKRTAAKAKADPLRRFCTERHVSVLPASPESVAAFLAHEAERQVRPSTIGRRVAAIRYAHKLAGLPLPTDDERVRATVRGMGCELSQTIFLLAAILLVLIAILLVMLFGASAVWSGLGWLAVIAIALAIIAVAIAVIPVAIAAIPGVLGYVAKLLVAPVVEPLRCWQSIRERRASGERVGPISASFEVLWTFVVSVFLWCFLVLILVGVTLALLQKTGLQQV
jgi:hypothetical protein